MTSRFRILWGITVSLGVLGVLLGLVLRYYFVEPLGFNFKHVLHAHSHVMLLGWLFNGLLLLLYRHWFAHIPRSHFLLFLGLQASVLGMLCSFPFQGYALYSITFSTLHIFISYVLLWKLWKHSRGKKLPGLLVRTGIVFHYLSTLGPYSLGPMMANDMRTSPWYDQAIYFYLHFQYNGFLFMLLLALMILNWKQADTRFRGKIFTGLMAGGVVLTWAHSLDFSFNSLWINLAGFTGAVLQLAAGFMLLRALDSRLLKTLATAVLTAFVLKLLFQVFGSLPAFADEVAHNRYLIIAYLHFIFLGIYTPFIWQLMHGNSSLVSRGFYWFFFLLTELALVLPILGFFTYSQTWMSIIFWLYAGLALSWISLVLQHATWRKSQPLT